jgi:hypothetical protein
VKLLPLVTCVVLCASAFCSGETFPTYGVSVDPPLGWKPMQRDEDAVVVRWLPGDVSPKHATILVSISMGRPLEKSAEKAAESYVTKHGGKVINDGSTLDGEAAIHVRGEYTAKDWQPVDSLLLFRNGMQYVVEVMVTKAQPTQEVLEQIRKSWKWTDIKLPSEVLDDLVWARVPKTNISVQIPRCAAVFKGMETRPSIQVALSDRPRADYEALLLVQVMGTWNKDVDKFEQLTGKLLNGAKAKLPLDRDLKWAVLDPEKQIAVSGVSKHADKPDTQVILVLRRLESGETLMANFSLVTKDAKVLKRYEEYANSFAAAGFRIDLPTTRPAKPTP